MASKIDEIKRLDLGEAVDNEKKLSGDTETSVNVSSHDKVEETLEV